MTRTSLAIFLAASMMATVGCASKNYVKQQTTPLINKTNELDDMTAKNTKDIKDVDARAQAGIQTVQAKAADVDQKAQAAGQTAASAQQTADAANTRVGVLTNTVVNLDNYHSVSEASVKFGFDKDALTPQAKEERHGFNRPGGLQLRSKPAPCQCCDSVSGFEVQCARPQDLHNRIGQGQTGRVEQDRSGPA